MNHDLLALAGCALCLLLAGGILGISRPLGQLLHRRGTSEPTEGRTVAFRVPETTAESETDRRAA